MQNRSPKSVVKTDLEVRSINKWQREWDQTTKGKITKEYYPSVAERLKMKKMTTHNLTTMITGHGNTNAYLHRFKIANSPTCLCGEADQTTDHLLYDCNLLEKQRYILRSTISTSEDWPISKQSLVSKHYKAFKRFTNQISFENLH